MEQNEKPYQSLAWLATGILIIAAALASFVPELEYHHWAFISANTLWVYVGWLWKEQSLWVKLLKFCKWASLYVPLCPVISLRCKQRSANEAVFLS